MISIKRCNNLATPRSTRLCGSLPIKKRTFEPFKTKTGQPSEPKPFDGTSDGTISTCDHKIRAVVSRDSDDASFRQESTIGVKSLAMGSIDHRNDDSISSSSEDRILQNYQGSAHQQIVALHMQHPSKISMSPQDRRFTETLNETRCSATTTRGRACAYIAVGNSIYCNMHADYETNPSPRKGSPKSKAKAKEQRRAGREAVTVDEDMAVASPVLARSVDTFGTLKTCATRLEISEDKEMEGESTNRLLSMISTDQWFQKKVRVGAGPLKGRKGHVEKWGNGWVSVYISGVGLHNRRSFELYLHSYDEVGDPTEMNELQTKPIYGERSSACLQQPLPVSRKWDGDCYRNIGPSVVTPRARMTSQTLVASRASQISSPIRLLGPWDKWSKEPGTCNIVTPPTRCRSLVSESTNIPSLNSSSGTVAEGHSPATTPTRVRGRRSVHKLLRFHETQMLENIHGTRKRSRSRGDEEDNEKRSRYGLHLISG